MIDTHETSADIIAEMRFHGQQNIDAEKDKPEYGILTVEGRIAQNYADRLEAAHKRELDALNEQITDLRQQRDLWSKRAAELVEKCNEQYAKLKQVGNAAKLREALKLYDRIIQDRTLICDCDIVYGARTLARAALAAPARNCDALSAHEQTARFAEFCKSHIHSDLPKCAGCPLEDIPDGTGCAQAWAQLPYEKGENNGNE